MRLSSILHPLPKYIFCQYFKCTSFGVRDNGYYWRQMSQTDKFPFIKKITFWYLYNGKECINLVSLTESCPLHPSFKQCNTIRIGFSMLQKWFIQLNIFNCYWWWNYYLITVNSASDITSRHRTLTVECNLLINFIVLLS